MENNNFGSWLETPLAGFEYELWYLYNENRSVNGFASNTNLIGVRPVIEVPKSNIEY